MPYPAAPWTLKGSAIQTLHFLDVAAVRPCIPPELKIVEVLPGKTLGSVYLATYEAGSVLEYHELIVACGLVRRGKHLGGWISHIYVDNPDSMAGGRDIWGLPKELAEFDWSADRRGAITVHQAGQTLCQLTYQTPFSLWEQPFTVPALSQLEGRILSFSAQARFRPGLVQSQLEITASSPFSPLHLGWTWLTVHLADLEMVVSPPVEVP